jgi:hypothetical protein
VSLVALAAGIVALVRDREITPKNRFGQLYLATTLITVLTGFGIFQHGGFGKPHALGVVTLVVLGIAALADRTALFGRAAVYVSTVSYSATFLFHWIPAITETATRLPPGAPLAANPDVPGLQAAAGVLVLMFLVGATLQVRRLRAASRPALPAAQVATTPQQA